MQIFCDFDGTISTYDTTDVILKRFASSKWETIEAEWESELIGSAQCMQRQIALITASKEELDSELNTIPIDSAFLDFTTFCSSRNLPLTIISDGVDYFIKHITQRHGISNIPIIANRLIVGDNGYSLKPANTDSDCPSGVCKCRSTLSYSDLRVYIGDGRSDFCVAGKSDIVFAKHSLAEYCEKNNIPYIPYADFSDVKNELLLMLSPTSPHIGELLSNPPFNINLTESHYVNSY